MGPIRYPIHDPASEQARLAALWSTGLLDTAPEERFDRLTRLVKQFFDVPIAVVTLIDRERVWFKSCLGLEGREVPRSVSFCTHALDNDEPLVVEDALANPTYAAGPLVAQSPYLRFYAGYPLKTPQGLVLGMLCVLDSEPRSFTPADLQALGDFAALVESELNVSVLDRALGEQANELARERQFARLILAHAGEGIFGIDRGGTTTFVNPAAAQMLGYTPEDLIGYNQHQSVHTSPTAGAERLVECPIYETLLTGEGREVTDEVFWHSSGEPVHVDLVVTPIKEHHTVTGAVVIFRDASRRRAAAERAQQELERLQGMLETMRDVARAQNDLDHVVRLILTRAMAMTQAHGAVIEERRGEELVYRYATGSVQPYEGVRLRAQGSLSGLCVTTGCAQVSSDVEQDPRVDVEACRRMGVRSMLMVPLSSGGETFAVLKVVSAAPRAFSAVEEQTLAVMGEFVGDAITQSSAYQEKQRVAEHLSELNERLLQADRYKDEFLSVISHELRTPLNFITGFASIMADGGTGPVTPQQERHLEKILAGADRMLRLVDDLLDFSKLQAGKFTLELAPTDVRRVVDETLSSLRPLAENAGVTLAGDVDVPGLPALDGARLTQVLTNLVGNAIKFARGGRVKVVARQEGVDVLFRVSDTGQGIAAQDLPKLFMRFQQLDMSSTRVAGGTGLGLAISKALVEAHGGTIGVESTPGVGSTFWFRVPAILTR